MVLYPYPFTHFVAIISYMQWNHFAQNYVNHTNDINHLVNTLPNKNISVIQAPQNQKIFWNQKCIPEKVTWLKRCNKKKARDYDVYTTHKEKKQNNTLYARKQTQIHCTKRKQINMSNIYIKCKETNKTC